MTFKNAWFQIHWILGITAGLILMIVGTTGAILSFEREIVHLLNTDLITVKPQPNATRLSPQTLLTRIQTAHPDRTVNALTFSKDPFEAARVNFALPGTGKRARRGETRYVDPYTGQVRWQDEIGHDFFHTVMALHRWLLLDKPGKQIVGASTLALIVLVLSGLYLRWPKTWHRLKTWLTFNPQKTGRGFLSDLHAVIGTWVLIFLLLASFTGLYWSYDWYRSGLYAITGVSKPVRGGSKQAKPSPQKQPAGPSSTQANSMQIDQAWQAFEQHLATNGYRHATLRLPKNTNRYEFQYFDPQPAHSRARNTLVLEGKNWQAIKHQRYEDKAFNEKIMSSMLPLHTGEFFGLPGRILLFITALSLPLFGITGFMLYMDRRKTAKLRREAKQQANLKTVPLAQADTVIVYASQNGSAERLAWLTGQILQDTDRAISLTGLGELTPEQLADKSLILLIASTFGEGEAPDSARRFVKHLEAVVDFKPDLQFAVLALGDRHYEHFCTFGLALDNWMRQSGATALQPCTTVDKLNPKNLQAWQNLLIQLGGNREVSLIAEPDEWRLTERTLLNPGSQGMPTYHLCFEPANAKTVDWQAGDLVELTLKDNQTTETRQYSIASIPETGGLQLLVRQVRFENNTLGKGSGFLTDSLTHGQTAYLTIQSHSAFHLDTNHSGPLILIGNGTGLAGLRAHLQQRIQHGHYQNWLLFGERNQASDFYYQDELNDWLKNGQLEKLTTAFSREQEGYVQDKLREAGEEIQSWVQQGAVILVCGSADTMAKAVDDALQSILSPNDYQTLLAHNGYLRDIY